MNHPRSGGCANRLAQAPVVIDLDAVRDALGRQRHFPTYLSVAIAAVVVEDMEPSTGEDESERCVGLPVIWEQLTLSSAARPG